MKHLSTLVAFLFPFGLVAQPIIQYDGLQLLGNTYDLLVVSDPGSGDPSTDGGPVTWDFSTATLDQAAMGAFVSPSTTPYADGYPAANLALIITVSGTSYYSYYTLDTDGLHLLASNLGSPSPTVYTDPSTILQFPYAFSDAFTDDFAYDGDTYSVIRTYTGYGTLQLPFGTFADVVKQTDSDGGITFFHSDPGGPLMSLDVGEPVFAWQQTTEGVAENTPSSLLSVSPNPSTSAIRLDGLTGAATWQFLDVQGRTVSTGRTVYTSEVIDLSSLASGAYQCVVRDAIGRRSARVVKQ